MNNKSFYALLSMVALLDLILLIRPMEPWGEIAHAVICGGSLYYVGLRLRQKSPNAWMVLMLAVGVLYNPFVPFRLSLPLWVLCDVLVMALFYLLARTTPLSATSADHKHDDEKTTALE